MHFAIDINQTICGSNAGEIYAVFQNTDLALDIDPNRLQKISYFHFLLLPEVKAFRKENEREFQASRQRAINNPDVFMALEPIPGAVRAVARLYKLGDICYYTACIPHMRATTQNWLEQHQFPKSENVACYSRIQKKVMALAEHYPPTEQIILIDEQGHTHFLETLEMLKGSIKVQRLLVRLTILAFGANRCILPEKPICRLFELPAWSELAITLAQVKKEL